jgi:hypothetical protein
MNNTLKGLEKELFVIDAKIAKYPAGMVRKIRAVESMRLHISEQVEALDIGSEHFDPGSLDLTEFAAKNHKALSRVQTRLGDLASFKVVVDHYDSDSDFVKVSDKLLDLATERARVAVLIGELNCQLKALKAEEAEELDRAKAQALEDVEKTGTTKISELRDSISQLVGVST